MTWLMGATVTTAADKAAEAKAAVLSALISAVQSHLDAEAQKLGYDSIASAVTYADEPAIAKFQAEGQAFRAWRSQVWASGYMIMAEVEAGTRAVPTATELVALLPVVPSVLP